jgi:hypothetical protein
MIRNLILVIHPAKNQVLKQFFILWFLQEFLSEQFELVYFIIFKTEL